jgi:hypothetical protein
MCPELHSSFWKYRRNTKSSSKVRIHFTSTLQPDSLAHAGCRQQVHLAQTLTAAATCQHAPNRHRPACLVGTVRCRMSWAQPQQQRASMSRGHLGCEHGTVCACPCVQCSGPHQLHATCWLHVLLPHAAAAGAKVLDLGCVPGAWMQVACKELGPHDRGGLVLGIDIQEVC